MIYKKIAKYNATGYGATNLAKMSIDMIRYEYPEYKDLTNNQVINKVFIGDPNAFFSKSQIKATIRSYYTMPAYINEIEKHAEMYNLGIGESESQIADISAFDPNWQTIIWEVIGTCESLFGIYV